MLLSEELYKIGIETVLNKESIHKASLKMLELCVDKCNELLTQDLSNFELKVGINKINNAWVNVAQRMQKKDKGWIRPDGFKRLMLHAEPQMIIFFDK